MLPPDCQEGLVVSGNSYYQSVTSGRNPEIEAARRSGLDASCQEELAVRMHLAYIRFWYVVGAFFICTRRLPKKSAAGRSVGWRPGGGGDWGERDS